MSDWEIRREQRDDAPGVEVITVDRPPVNALSFEMFEELRQIFSLTMSNTDIRCFVFTGSGSRAFSAGADVRQYDKLDPTELPGLMKLRRLGYGMIRECPVPVVGAINGPAMGAGLALAAACDIVVAADTARFGIPEINVGVVGGAKALSRMFPLPLVRYMALTGRSIGATEAAALGGVVRVVPLPELLTTAVEIATTIAAKPPSVTRLAKESLNLVEAVRLEDGYQIEQLYSMVLHSLPEAQQMAKQFLEGKRVR